jgi:hypothetical protein
VEGVAEIEQGGGDPPGDPTAAEDPDRRVGRRLGEATVLVKPRQQPVAPGVVDGVVARRAKARSREGSQECVSQARNGLQHEHVVVDADLERGVVAPDKDHVPARSAGWE